MTKVVFRLLPLVMAVFLLITEEVQAATVKFCIQHTGTYADNDVGEDYWVLDEERDARGVYVVLTKGFAVLYAGYAGDGLGTGDPGPGCTPELTVASANGDYDLNIYSYGEVNNNYVESRNSSGNTVNANTEYTVSAGSGTYDVPFGISTTSTAFRVFNVMHAGAYALYRHAGGMSGEEYIFQLTTGGSRFDPSLNRIWINDDSTPHTDDKFVIVHETGHAILDHATGGAYWFGSNNYGASNNCDEEPSSTDHSMRSREHDIAAFAEGFAHFYAADVWNDHDENDCAFRYYKLVDGAIRTVNCESENTNELYFETYYHETQCAGGAGYGVELDWLRAFWDIHTNGSAPDPTFTDIVDWATYAVFAGGVYGAPYGRNGAYDALNATVSFYSDIESTWDQSGVGNTLDGI